MKVTSEMNKEFFENKKIEIEKDNKHYFYTIKKVIELTDIYILFIDKFDKEKYIRLQDISDVL